jgi:Asp-tRNA(Asn)/Glu-tRNA(Gln) amidotransferase A subunit family amidase
MTTTLTRRTFLFSALAGALSASAQTRPPVTFSEWLRASRPERARALQSCLDRIAAADPAIQAWVQVSPQRPIGDGALSEIPFGAKDIIETQGLSTAYGSPVYSGRVATTTAAIVRDLRQRGAVLLGKTHTTAFAYRTPAPTRNPRNPAHTPGGSSAGSAAAVAADMIPLALGTQTRGSVLRPASYCGVTGFKATYGLFPLEGVLPLAASLDTLGFFTHTPADMLAFWEALGRPLPAEQEIAFGVPEPPPDVEAPMAAAFEQAIAVLRKRGASLRTVDISGMLSRLSDDSNVVQAYEAARHHEVRYREHGDKLQDLAALVREGLQMPKQTYDDAMRSIAECKSRFAALYETTPIMLVPAATGPAPVGFSTTGDPRMNAPWTALGTPAISAPMPVSGLPLGLQLTGRPGADGLVIRAAVRVHRMLYA